MSRDVQNFYDAFRDRRMIGYRVDGSSRIQAAYVFATRHLSGRSTIADIGCGIGIFAELVGKKFPCSRVIAVDVSESNIAYAKETVSAQNVTFSAASITSQFSTLQELAGGRIEAFCMIDVIEHIPEGSRSQVLLDMAAAGSENAVLILSYPSPEYQRHLISKNPGELQIIDNVVETATLVSEAETAGWHLKEFRYVDLWMANQYIHAAFQLRFDVETCRTRASFVSRVRFHFDRYILRPRRVRRYGRG